MPDQQDATTSPSAAARNPAVEKSLEEAAAESSYPPACSCHNRLRSEVEYAVVFHRRTLKQPALSACGADPPTS